MTAAGELRQVIEIQARTKIRDDAGEPRDVWGVVARRRAEKTSTPGGENFTANQRVARVPTVFRIRYPRDFAIIPAMRVIHLGVTYDIQSVVDRDGRRVDMFLTCLELVEETE